MKKPASLLVGIFLFIIAFIQLLRFTFSVDIVVNGFAIPDWWSAIAAIFLGSMSFWLLNEWKNGD